MKKIFAIISLGFLTPFNLPAYGQVNELSASTGTTLPYSVQTKNLLKRLFNNATVVGGQVIALKGSAQNGGYDANYFDIGALGGVKKGDLFVLFTPEGDAVGFARITETQQYTSSFEFVELTVAPSEDLIGKKVGLEIRNRIPDDLVANPALLGTPIMKRSRRHSASQIMPPSVISSTTPSNPMPPLPGGTPQNQQPAENGMAPNGGGSSLPPLPESGTTPSSELTAPAVSGEAAVPTDNSSLPSLPPMDTTSESSGMAQPGVQSLPADNAGNGLPPLQDSNSTPGLPALPSDQNTTSPDMSNPTPGTQALPPLGDTSNGLPTAPNDNSGLPALPSDNSGLPASPMAPSSSTPADNGNALPPLSTTDTGTSPAPAGLPDLSGTDSELPPLATPAQPTSSDNSAPSGLPPLSMDGQGPPDNMSNAGLPDLGATAPSSDSNLPTPDQISGVPDVTASTSSNGLPPLDNSDASLPTVTPDVSQTTTPPVLASDQGLPALDDNSSVGLPSLDGTQGTTSSMSSLPVNTPSASNAANLGLPAVPSTANTGYLQDIPTFTATKKPAA